MAAVTEREARTHFLGHVFMRPEWYLQDEAASMHSPIFPMVASPVALLPRQAQASKRDAHGAVASSPRTHATVRGSGRCRNTKRPLPCEFKYVEADVDADAAAEVPPAAKRARVATYARRCNSAPPCTRAAGVSGWVFTTLFDDIPLATPRGVEERGMVESMHLHMGWPSHRSDLDFINASRRDVLAQKTDLSDGEVKELRSLSPTYAFLYSEEAIPCFSDTRSSPPQSPERPGAQASLGRVRSPTKEEKEKFRRLCEQARQEVAASRAARNFTAYP